MLSGSRGREDGGESLLRETGADAAFSCKNGAAAMAGVTPGAGPRSVARIFYRPAQEKFPDGCGMLSGAK